MYAEVIGIGDELLYGQTVNSNASEIALRLIAIGIEVKYLTTIGDNAEEMWKAFDTALQRCDIVITTGGLGPTPDDFTQKVVAEYFGFTIREFDDMLKDVEEKYSRLNRPMPEFARNQAWFPDGAARIYNPIGTATGIEVERNGKFFFALPGVPSEAMIMTDQTIITRLEALPKSEVIATKTVRTIGWGETMIQEKIGNDGLQKIYDAGCGLAFLPKHGMVDLRLTARASTKSDAEAKIDAVLPILMTATATIRYAMGNDSLVDVIKRELEARNAWLATAESCTGGAIAALLTETPGISAVYRGGVVSYHNDVKQHVLNVPENILVQYGAVSEECAKAMAEGAARKLNADYAIAVTGISGPGGGTPEKPVGTVCLGLCAREIVEGKPLYRTITRKERFPGPRHVHRIRTINMALKMVWEEITKL
ncbi:MAG: competence/damage-inducible protein A [bacterium]|nr:competence/damage-inducible protein A [bacterium]